MGILEGEVRRFLILNGDGISIEMQRTRWTDFLYLCNLVGYEWDLEDFTATPWFEWNEAAAPNLINRWQIGSGDWWCEGGIVIIIILISCGEWWWWWLRNQKASMWMVLFPVVYLSDLIQFNLTCNWKMCKSPWTLGNQSVINKNWALKRESGLTEWKNASEWMDDGWSAFETAFGQQPQQDFFSPTSSRFLR